MEEKSNDIHSVRVPATLWSHIVCSSKKCGITPSEYLRRLIQKDKGHSPMPAITQEQYLLQKEKIHSINQLTYEINSIGININQVAKRVNSQFYTGKEIEGLLELQQQLIAIVEKYIKGL